MLNMIQRCTIARPLSQERLGVSLRFDYMGASEFEQNAAARSLIAMYVQQDALQKARYTDILDEQGRSLRLYGLFADSNPEDYRRALLDHIKGKRPCREPSYFPQKVQKADGMLLQPSASARPLRCGEDIDCWWDLHCHVIFTFDKNFAGRLSQLVQASWDYMQLAKIAP
ncbi:MAG: hypothetical protein K2Y32_14990 [Candidatus Obscuribacterales bacterium]|nr:hypothetical protein [Candidatus Obscuribacterales bacterium]